MSEASGLPESVSRWHAVGPVEAFDVDLPEEVSVPGGRIAVFRTRQGFHATAPMCTHEDERLFDGYFEDGVIECPKHMARFDVRTGRALCLPATKPLLVYPCEVRDGLVWVQVPEAP